MHYHLIICNKQQTVFVWHHTYQTQPLSSSHHQQPCSSPQAPHNDATDDNHHTVPITNDNLQRKRPPKNANDHPRTQTTTQERKWLPKNANDHARTQMTAQERKWPPTNANERQWPLTTTNDHLQWKRPPTDANNHLRKETTTYQWKWPPTDSNNCPPRGIQPNDKWRMSFVVDFRTQGKYPTIPCSSQPLLLINRTTTRGRGQGTATTGCVTTGHWRVPFTITHKPQTTTRANHHQPNTSQFYHVINKVLFKIELWGWSTGVNTL